MVMVEPIIVYQGLKTHRLLLKLETYQRDGDARSFLLYSSVTMTKALLTENDIVSIKVAECSVNIGERYFA
jgi:hypothetical protein